MEVIKTAIDGVLIIEPKVRSIEKIECYLRHRVNRPYTQPVALAAARQKEIHKGYNGISWEM